MRTTKLPQIEAGVCRRMREARDFLGITQETCARQIGIERGTLANYEYAKAPVKAEVALRFCRNLIVNEEWLATGSFEIVAKVARRKGLVEFDQALKRIFLRHPVDLLSDPTRNQIPPGALYAEAFEVHLKVRYYELLDSFFYLPRIVFSDAEETQVAANLLGALLERWFDFVGNGAFHTLKGGWEARRQFAGRMIEFGDVLARRFMGDEIPEISDVVRAIAHDPSGAAGIARRSSPKKK
jgi:transcriptional regulator with XRE-family HTH domain